MQQIDDLLVRVSRREPGSTSYVVEMWLEGGRHVNAQDELQLDDYAVPSLGGATSLATHGIELFNRLFSGRLSVAFQQAWAAAVTRNRILRVRLALDATAPALHAVPWELLHFDDSGGMSPARAMAADSRIAFSRYIESATFDEGVQVSRRPVRLLLVISDPHDLKDRWDLVPVGRATEERDFRTRFSSAVSSGQFCYDILPIASAEALQSAIAQGGIDGEQPSGYDVLLFMGHAAFHEQYGSRLLLEDAESRRARLYSADDLVSLVQQLPKSHRMAMVILVACNSAATTTNNALNSLAARLVIAGGVPAVLAMQRLVEITLARRFTYHLSDHLLRDGVIDVAVNTARRRVFTLNDVGWSTPTLYMRYADGRLFTPNPQLEYIEGILTNPTYVRWSGSEFIESGVLVVSPGQSWNLLCLRPEDAPASVSVIETLHHIIDSGQPSGRRRHVTSAVRHSNVIAVIGPPHSGQTTILQRLAHDLAMKLTNNPSSPLGVMISLIGYETQRGSGRLEHQIVEQARAANAALGDALADLFRSQTTAPTNGQPPRYIFLLDNLDCLPEKARIDAASDMSVLAARLIDQQFVITSSQESFPAQAISDAHVLVIQPLNEQQIFRYIRQREEHNAYQIFGQIRDNRLLALASDPSLLALIYTRMAGDQQTRLTRNQLVREYLDHALGNINPRYNIGDAAHESLGALAWHSRWNHLDHLPLSDAFRVMADVRRDRDYSLEDLYLALCEARLLSGVSQGAVRFVNPAIQMYCAAVALTARLDRIERLRDIITLCSNPQRQIWWEDVIYALAGLISDPVPLFENLAAAIRAGSYTHALIAARCLEALPPDQDAHLPTGLRNELLDACVLRLRADREPDADRREQIATALGRMNHPQVRDELRRILIERVRKTSSGMRYEYTNVRIAAARALRNIYLPSSLKSRRDDPRDELDDLLLTRNRSDMVSLADQVNVSPSGTPPVADDVLVRLMRIWAKQESPREDEEERPREDEDERPREDEDERPREDLRDSLSSASNPSEPTPVANALDTMSTIGYKDLQIALCTMSDSEYKQLQDDRNRDKEVHKARKESRDIPPDPAPTASGLDTARRLQIALRTLSNSEYTKLQEARNEYRRIQEARTEFRLLLNSEDPPERALAAFALADMRNVKFKKLQDARHLLRVILGPRDTADAVISTDREDTMWAAADALTLFEPSYVAPLLTVLARRKRNIPDSAAQQLAYLAGRIRATDEDVIDWLINLLVTNPSQMIKSKALQSLAWMGMGTEKRRLDLGDGRPGPTLKEIIQDIAAGRTIRPLKRGVYTVTPYEGDIDGKPAYLRSKAIEALAWIGDADTLKDFDTEVAGWPLDLRERWYKAAAMIKERTGGT